MEATIAISKIITVISDNQVYNIKSQVFETEIEKFSTINIKGYFSKSKFNKYVGILVKKGFSISKTMFVDFSENGKDVDFYLEFSK